MTKVRITATVEVDIDLADYVRRNKLTPKGRTVDEEALHHMEVTIANAICAIAPHEPFQRLEISATKN